MSFNFSKVSKSTASTSENQENPVEFFYKLNHPKVDELWPSQKEILEKWHKEFGKSNDQIIQLATGAGKTLIGLYSAESLRRRKKGKVLYLCVNNYLAEQAKEKADEYGIKASTYFGGEWHEENEYLANDQICITNYDAVFNPQSKFRRHEIVGVIFDDSHSAIDLFENQFTLTFKNGEVMREIFKLFANNENINNLKEFADPTKLYMIPPMSWWSNIPYVKKLLSRKKGDFDLSNKFAWTNLQDRMESTLCFCTANSIQISPLYPESSSHFIFQKEISRIYLSATSSNTDDMIRTFGIKPEIISINNPTYRPDRLFLFSKKMLNFENVEELFRNNPLGYANKALVLVPSKQNFEVYKKDDADLSFIESPSEIKDKITEFKLSKKKALVIANRYEGIDMAGDSCHFLIIDNVFCFSSLKERFLTDSMGLTRGTSLRSNMASKITQAFGRTTRGASDYSVIVVMGEGLNKTLINTDNHKYFKKELVEDLKIGMSCSESIKNESDLKGLIKEMLSQSEEYKEFIESRRTQLNVAEEISQEELETREELASRERDIVSLFFDKKYNMCLEKISKRKEFQEVLELYFSEKTLAVYFLIASFCAIKTGNIKVAKDYNTRAGRMNNLLDDSSFAMNEQKKETQQAKNIKNKRGAFCGFIWNSNNNNIEEDLKQLGLYLGFESKRPEKESEGTTLDCLWVDDEKKYVVGIEIKSNKENKTINKGEVDQSLGHNEWLKTEYGDYDKKMFILGDIEKRTSNTNPGDELLKISLSDIESVSSKVGAVYENRDIFPGDIQEKIDSYDLSIETLFKGEKIVDLLVSE